MLDKIILSRDRHSATVYFDTHSFNFSSDGDVMVLVYEMILEPLERWKERERIGSEDTVEIELQLTLFPREAA